VAVKLEICLEIAQCSNIMSESTCGSLRNFSVTSLDQHNLTNPDSPQTPLLPTAKPQNQHTIMSNKLQLLRQHLNQLFIHQSCNRYTLECPIRNNDIIESSSFAFRDELGSRAGGRLNDVGDSREGGPFGVCTGILSSLSLLCMCVVMG